MEITNIFDTWGMGKLNVVYTYNVRSIHIEGNEVLSPTTEWTNLQNTVLRERSRLHRTAFVWFHLCVMPRTVESMQTESR